MKAELLRISAKMFGLSARVFPPVAGLFNRPDSLRIIYYHRVNERNDPYYFDTGISPAVFRRQLELLSRTFTVITLREALAMPPGGFRNHLCITFDDGFRECYDVIRPILREFGFRATFFVTEKAIDNLDMLWRNKLLTVQNLVTRERLTAIITRFQEAYDLPLGPNLLASSNTWKMAEKDEMADFVWRAAGIGTLADYLREHQPYMSEAQIRELLAEGHEVGSHTYSHPFCGKLSRAEIDEEIIRSAARIADRFDTRCDTFSYPFGDPLSVADEKYVLENSGIRLLLGIADKLANVSGNHRWERVGMEKAFDRSLLDFYALARLARIKAR